MSWTKSLLGKKFQASREKWGNDLKAKLEVYRAQLQKLNFYGFHIETNLMRSVRTNLIKLHETEKKSLNAKKLENCKSS